MLFRSAGKPLDLDDDRLVPQECRAAYRILKNAGCVPPELDARREEARLAKLLIGAAPDRRARVLVTLALLRTAQRG